MNLKFIADTEKPTHILLKSKPTFPEAGEGEVDDADLHPLAGQGEGLPIHLEVDAFFLGVLDQNIPNVEVTMFKLNRGFCHCQP